MINFDDKSIPLNDRIDMFLKSKGITEDNIDNFLNEIKILKSMGYRQLKNSSKFAKPVGYCLFVFDVETREFANCFKHANGKQTVIYSAAKFNEEIDDFLSWLKSVECITRTNIDNISDFEFLDLCDSFDL